MAIYAEAIAELAKLEVSGEIMADQAFKVRNAIDAVREFDVNGKTHIDTIKARYLDEQYAFALYYPVAGVPFHAEFNNPNYVDYNGKSLYKGITVENAVGNIVARFSLLYNKAKAQEKLAEFFDHNAWHGYCIEGKMDGFENPMELYVQINLWRKKYFHVTGLAALSFEEQQNSTLSTIEPMMDFLMEKYGQCFVTTNVKTEETKKLCEIEQTVRDFLEHAVGMDHEVCQPKVNPNPNAVVAPNPANPIVDNKHKAEAAGQKGNVMDDLRNRLANRKIDEKARFEREERYRNEQKLKLEMARKAAEEQALKARAALKPIKPTVVPAKKPAANNGAANNAAAVPFEPMRNIAPPPMPNVPAVVAVANPPVIALPKPAKPNPAPKPVVAQPNNNLPVQNAVLQPQQPQPNRNNNVQALAAQLGRLLFQFPQNLVAQPIAIPQPPIMPNANPVVVQPVVVVPVQQPPVIMPVQPVQPIQQPLPVVAVPPVVQAPAVKLAKLMKNGII